MARTLVQGAGTLEVALVAQDPGEVVQAAGGVGVVGAELRLTDRQGPLVEAAGRREEPVSTPAASSRGGRPGSSGPSGAAWG
jgi:hypothetical protein